MNEKLSGIYQIMNMVTGVFYIGSSKDMMRRRQVHFCELRNNRHCNPKLQHSFNKYGEGAFVFGVVEFCPVENLFAREDWHLRTTGATVDGVGYNLSIWADSPSRGRTPSLDSRLKMSRAQKGRKKAPFTEEHIENMRNAQRARTRPTLTEEERRRMGDSSRGKPWTDERRAKMVGRMPTFAQPHTPEAKEKMRRAKLGKPSPRKGAVMSAESRAKMSAAKLGKQRPPTSAETRAKIAAAKRGKPRSRETIEKVRAALTGRKLTDAAKAQKRETIARNRRLKEEAAVQESPVQAPTG